MNSSSNVGPGTKPLMYVAPAAGVLPETIGTDGKSATMKSWAFCHSACWVASSEEASAATIASFIASFLYAYSGFGPSGSPR